MAENSKKQPRCICCLCSCGEHKCFFQDFLKLPLRMQKELANKIPIKEEHAIKIHKTPAFKETVLETTYKQDYQPRPIIDRAVPEKLETNLKPESGKMSEQTIYSKDFVPWGLEEQQMFRTKQSLLEPENGVAETGLSSKSLDKLLSYYCPPHCIPEKPSSQKRFQAISKKTSNFLPKKDVGKSILKPTQPFEKYTSHMLDYKPYELPLRQDPTKDEDNDKKPFSPMTSETTYNSSFKYPQQDRRETPIHDNNESTLKIGTGPMVRKSSCMVDYRDPDVKAHKVVKPAKQIYKPPSEKMETDTTSKISYPGWKVKPDKEIIQDKHKSSVDNWSKGSHNKLVTVYQEDFDGLPSALCPYRVAERYGMKCLEPKYHYQGTKRNHDILVQSSKTKYT